MMLIMQKIMGTGLVVFVTSWVVTIIAPPARELTKFMVVILSSGLVLGFLASLIGLIGIIWAWV